MSSLNSYWEFFLRQQLLLCVGFYHIHLTKNADIARTWNQSKLGMVQELSNGKTWQPKQPAAEYTNGSRSALEQVAGLFPMQVTELLNGPRFVNQMSHEVS